MDDSYILKTTKGPMTVGEFKAVGKTIPVDDWMAWYEDLFNLPEYEDVREKYRQLKLTGIREDKRLMQALHDNEINFSVSSFSGGGFRVTLGDSLNGFKNTANVAKLDDVDDWLTEQVIKHYPDSALAKELMPSNG